MENLIIYQDFTQKHNGTKLEAVFKELAKVKYDYIPKNWIEDGILSIEEGNRAEVDDYWFITEETDSEKEYYLVVKFRLSKFSRFDASTDEYYHEGSLFVEKAYLLDLEKGYEVMELLIEITAIHERDLRIDWSRLYDFVFIIEIKSCYPGDNYSIQSIHTNESLYFAQMPNYNTDFNRDPFKNLIDYISDYMEQRTINKESDTVFERSR